MNNKTYLVFGVSRGLGKEIVRKIPHRNDIVYGVSRSRPDYLEQIENFRWMSVDLSQSVESIKKLKGEIGNHTVDVLIYNVGIWESLAFSNDYNFEKIQESETIEIINTNIASCILSIQSFLENLKQSNNAKVILIGSTWGLDNHNGIEVAFSASKFAIRGIAHSLRENLRDFKIGVSVINLGYLATDWEGEENVGKIINETGGSLIPLDDVISAIKFIVSTSSSTCVK